MGYVERLFKSIANKVLSKELNTLKATIKRQEAECVYFSKHAADLQTELTEAKKLRNVTIRLRRDVFDHFRKTHLQRLLVGSGSTELQVAFLVGQQSVVEILERELVVDE